MSQRKQNRKRRYIRSRRNSRRRLMIRHRLCRCCYNNDEDQMNNFMTNMANMRIGFETETEMIDYSGCKFEITVPMIFHLIDKTFGQDDVSKWTNHINSKIIPVLNIDFNKNRDNFSDQLNKMIDSICSNADKVKKDYYKSLPNVLPHNTNVKWIFTLERVIINSHPDLVINSSSNEGIYKKIPAIDPERNLNIIIAPSTNILGISIFPFVDRDPEDSSIIHSNFLYRNSVLIATSAFLGNTKPYNMFRTLTHEIGHWCGLLHPFDNFTKGTMEIIKYGLNNLEIKYGPDIDRERSGDLISDTIHQEYPTYGYVKNSFKVQKGKNIHYGPYAWIFKDNDKYSNFLNFMDYTDDAQLVMFTNIQMIRMIYYIKRFRPNFIKHCLNHLKNH